MSTNFLENKLIIEELSLSDNIDDLVNNDYYLDEDLNINYSYPYFTTATHEYQYRLTIDNSVLLEEVKCDDINNEYIVLKTICELDLETGLSLIYNNIDIRDENQNILEVTNDIIEYDLTDGDAKEILENNKSIVLLELYKSIQ